MTEESTQVENSASRYRFSKRRWLRPATGTSAYRAETDGQQTSTSLSVIVPAYNEQYLVEASLERLKILETSPLLHRVQVVVVNDGSKDSTAEAIARFRSSLEPDRPDSKLQWTWLQHDSNQGKGAAIRTALAHAECELVVIHDADLEYHPWDLLQMIELFLYEDADAVFGSRFMSGGHKRALFFRHALGNKFLTFIVRPGFRP
jgi:glycosyltransferase involved in cell wall biosynthesis